MPESSLRSDPAAGAVSVHGSWRTEWSRPVPRRTGLPGTRLRTAPRAGAGRHSRAARPFRCADPARPTPLRGPSCRTGRACGTFERAGARGFPPVILGRISCLRPTGTAKRIPRPGPPAHADAAGTRREPASRCGNGPRPAATILPLVDRSWRRLARTPPDPGGGPGRRAADDDGRTRIRCAHPGRGTSGIACGPAASRIAEDSSRRAAGARPSTGRNLLRGAAARRGPDPEAARPPPAGTADGSRGDGFRPLPAAPAAIPSSGPAPQEPRSGAAGRGPGRIRTA